MPVSRRLVLAICLALVACGGDGGPGPTPASLAVLSGAGQTARRGTALAVRPSVRVRGEDGAVLPDVAVTFAVTSGGGAVAGGSTRTDASGAATVGGWTLGPEPGSNSLTATAGAASITITATAVAGPATTLAVHAGDGQSAAVNSSVAIPPAVLVTDGTFPVRDQLVTFSVTEGGGSASPAAVYTDSLGVAELTSWRLGPSGTQRLSATVAGLAPLLFSATVVPAVLASLTKLDGDAAGAIAGNFTPALPLVEVRNQSGGPMAGVAVTFAVTGGGGTAGFTTTTSDGQGRASPGYWRFGPGGPQSLSAATPGVAPVTFSGSAVPAPATRFDLQVVFLDPQPTDAQKAAFLAARDRWQRIIVGDVADYGGSIPAGTCGSGAPAAKLSGPIDDVVIFAGIRPIDGSGSVLAEAGPCLGRSTGRLTIAGMVIFDSADLGYLATLAGGLSDVAFHEFAHVLGFGTLWSELGVVQQPGSDQVAFTGPAARQAYASLLDPAQRPVSFDVPVENCVGLPNCGAGSRDRHWREPVFGPEIMTGFYNGLVANPYSAVSAASMRDLGYVVDDAAADAFALPLATGGLRAGVAAGTQAFSESLAPWPIRLVDEVGNEVGEVRR